MFILKAAKIEINHEICIGLFCFNVLKIRNNRWKIFNYEDDEIIFNYP